MIKFFRHIHKSLLVKNKTGKYFKYAIGEIILVVIGILIALQINNWNENRQQKQTLKNIYTIIVEDLTNDISDINVILKSKEDRKPIFNKVLDGLMTKEDYENCFECKYLIVGSMDLSIENRGYNLLNNFNSANTSEDNLTIKIIQFYTRQLTELHVDDRLRVNDIENTVNHWKDNYDWYADFMTERNSEGFIEYALNKHDYINKVANYYLLNYTIYEPILKQFNEEAKIILSLIKEKVNQ